MVEMRMLRWMTNIIRKDQLKNEVIRNRLGAASITNKLRENRLSWYVYVARWLVDFLIR